MSRSFRRRSNQIPRTSTRPPRRTTTPSSGTRTPSTAWLTASPTTTTPASPRTSRSPARSTWWWPSAGNPRPLWFGGWAHEPRDEPTAALDADRAGIAGRLPDQRRGHDADRDPGRAGGHGAAPATRLDDRVRRRFRGLGRFGTVRGELVLRH